MYNFQNLGNVIGDDVIIAEKSHNFLLIYLYLYIHRQVI